MQLKCNIYNYSRYAFYFLAILPIFFFRDFTLGNELRYLSIADEALRNKTFLTFTNHGIIYADKPPLYLWILMFGKWMFGYHNMIFLGMFSLIPALVIIILMDRWCRKILSPREAIAAQLMLMTTGFFIGSLIVLRMDMIMTMFITLALYTFFLMYKGQNNRVYSLLFPFYLFLAIFTKGPVGILIPFISIVIFLTLKRETKKIWKYWGWKTFLILIALCTIWFIGVYYEGGTAYLDNLLFHQTIGRAVNSFHHKEPFYYYFISIWYSLAPWSLLVVGTLIAGIRSLKDIKDIELFFLVITLSTFCILSLFSAKLAIYLLPAFPFFIYLTVLWLARQGISFWTLTSLRIPAIILISVFPALLVYSQLPLAKAVGVEPLVISAGVILTGIGVLSVKYLQSQLLHKSIILIGAGILLSVFVISFEIQHYNKYIGFGEICNLAKRGFDKNENVNYYYCGIPRGDQMEVYLGTVPSQLRICDLNKMELPIRTPAIIFTRQKTVEQNDSLLQFLQSREFVRYGDNYYIKVKK